MLVRDAWKTNAERTLLILSFLVQLTHVVFHEIKVGKLASEELSSKSITKNKAGQAASIYVTH